MALGVGGVIVSVRAEFCRVSRAFLLLTMVNDSLLVMVDVIEAGTSVVVALNTLVKTEVTTAVSFSKKISHSSYAGQQHTTH